MDTTSLESRLKACAAKAAATRTEWNEKHIPIRIGEKLYWVSTEIPKPIQKVLDVLPKEQETEPVKRPHQIKARLSDEELEAFDALLTASGLSQTDYIRGMVLNGSVHVTQTSQVDAKAVELLTIMSADLGRIAGMLRKTIIVNKEFSLLTPESKDRLERLLRQLRSLQSYIQRLAEDIHGNLQA